MLIAAALDQPDAPRLVPDFHGVAVNELHRPRDGFEVGFSLELARRSTDVPGFVDRKGSIDLHGPEPLSNAVPSNWSGVVILRTLQRHDPDQSNQIGLKAAFRGRQIV